MIQLGAPYSDAERRWILDTLTRDIHAAVRPHRGFSLVVTRRVLAYTLMPTAWGDTMVYGGEYERADVTDLLNELLDARELLPAAFITEHRNRDIIVARVWQRDGVKLLDSDSSETPAYSSTMALEPKFGALSVEMFVRPQRGGLVVFGDLPRSHLPFLLGMLALAAALSVVAVFQLRREQELAQMRSDFVSNVSHELRTPLTQIRLYSETLRFGRARTSEERDWSLRHIERETGRLNHLVDNILRFSRVGSADPAHAVAVDVAAEVESVVQEFQPLAASRRATVTYSLDARPFANLREDALRRMLLNLLDNAVKYGPEGQTVCVSLSELGGEVRVSVTDEGPGVAAAERETVWLPFQRGRAATNAAGSGIGLSVVRDIARQHSGRAWVERASNGGARFVVAFPVATPETTHT
jgi:signal transduction histidine kinase